MDKLPTPGLFKGIKILEYLKDGDACLEDLVKKSGFPKTSTLRILETLIAMNLVQKDKLSKSYHSLSYLENLSTASEAIQNVIHHEIIQISNTLNITTEWYEARDGFMLLSDRNEPPKLEISIRARKGYKRELNHELEAVTRIALSSGVHTDYKGSYWVVRQNGQLFCLSHEEQTQILAKTKELNVACDEYFNLHGVRRYASAVFDKENKLIGILAFAETFSPLHMEARQDLLGKIKIHSQNLSVKLQNMEPS